MSYAGKNLRYLRKLRGWTQEECANKLKVKRSLIGAYEEERAEPKLEVQKILCDIFKISFEDLLLKDMTIILAVCIYTLTEKPTSGTPAVVITCGVIIALYEVADV